MKIWKKLDDTGQLEEAMAELEMVMEWCSKSQMTEEHRVEANVIQIWKSLGIGADVLPLHATDPESGAAAEIDILGIIGHAASTGGGSETEHRACMFLLIVLCVPK